MTALTASEAIVIRQQPQTLKRYLSVCPRTPIWQAKMSSSLPVDLDPQSLGMIGLTYQDVTLGNYADVVPGLTLDFGSTPGGRDIGSVRIRKTATATQLLVAETAEGSLPGVINSTTYLTVVDERRIWNKLPIIIETKMTGQDYYSAFENYVDYDLAYTDEHQSFKPLANVTGEPAGFVDDGQTVRTVRLDGTLSAAVARSAAISTYTWDLVDGELAPGYSLTDAVIEAQFPQSRVFRYVTLTVTDSNGKSSTRWFPIWVHSDAHPPLMIHTGGFTIDRDETEEGREMDVVIFGAVDAASESVIPKGALMCYWEDDVWFAGEPAPGGYRKHFVGWSLRDSVLMQKDRSQYRVSISGPQGWLDRISGQYELFQRRTAPTQWYHMADVTDDRVIATILRERSTALDVCNLYLSGVSWEWGNPDTSDMGAAELSQMSLWRQIQQLTQEYSGAAGVDSAGSIGLRQDPNKLRVGAGPDRDDVATILTLSPADLPYDSPVELPDEVVDPVARVDINGAAWLGTASLLYQGRAPGWAPGMGTQIDQIRDQVLDPTMPATHLAALAGQWYAALNNPVSDLSLDLLGNLDVVEPAWMEWVYLNDTIANVRGQTITSRFLVKRVSIKHSNDPATPPKEISWTVSKETLGTGGVSKQIEVSDIVSGNLEPAGDWYPGDGYGEEPPPSGSAGSLALTYSCATSGLRRTRNFHETPPTWTSIYTPPSGYWCMEFELDNFDPKNGAVLVICSTADVCVLCTTNLDDAVPTFTVKQNIAAAAGQTFLRSSNQFQGTWFLHLNAWTNQYVAHTHDGWVTCTIVNAGCDNGNGNCTGFDVSCNASNVNSGRVWIGDRIPVDQDASVRLSYDFGLTFPVEKVVESATFSYQTHMIYTPWWGNPNELIAWAGGDANSVSESWLKRTADGGNTWDDRTPLSGGWGYGAGNRDYAVRTNRILHHFVTDLTWLALAGQANMDHHGGTNSRLFTSEDEGLNWVDKGLMGQLVTHLGGWPYDKNILIATGSSKIQYSEDWGLTWVEKQWAGFADGIVTIPVWVE